MIPLRPTLVVSLLALAIATPVTMAIGQVRDGGGGNAMVEQAPVLDPTKELATKIRTPFTVAAVGDLTIMRPIGNTADPDTQAALKLIRDADLGFGNMESNISDPPFYTGPLRGFMGVKEVAADIRSWGIRVVTKAGNHGFDSGPEGLMATTRLLEEAGVQYAGSGRNLAEARAPRFLELPAGRIGIMGLFSVGFGTAFAGPPLNDNATRAGDAWGNYTPAQPGQATLRVDQAYNVTQADIDDLQRIQNSLYVVNDEITTPRKAPSKERVSTITVGNSTYTVGTPGRITHTIDPEDLRQALRSVRGGKQYADFMLATIHSHNGKWAAEAFPEETSTPDFLIELAHKSIDNGADAFMGHGPHALRGIEIYKGRPIFYGLGQFVRQSDWRTPTRPDFEQFKTTPDTTDLTQAELGVLRTAGPGFRHREMYESIIAISKFDKGALREIHIHPVDLGFDRPLSQVGIPRLAHGAQAARILAHMQKVSAPFGTRIAIVGEVGIIKVTPATSGK